MGSISGCLDTWSHRRVQIRAEGTASREQVEAETQCLVVLSQHAEEAVSIQGS